ncbi:MAG TPA: hypothetical protein PKC72_11455 [Chitinophagaceae bacterium]|nr:hypothetical protein [Chitinophagaceae bacterium]
MKTATLIAIIAVSAQVFASLIYLLQSTRIMEYNRTVVEIIQPLYFLSNIGLLFFFIQLYQRQTKN